MRKMLKERGRWILLFILILTLPVILYSIHEFPHWWHYYSLERDGKWRSHLHLSWQRALSSGDILYSIQVANQGSLTWPKGMALGSCERAGNTRWGWRQTPPGAKIVAYTTRIPLVENGDRADIPVPVPPGDNFPLLAVLHPGKKPTKLFLQMVDDRPHGVGWFGEEITMEIASK